MGLFHSRPPKRSPHMSLQDQMYRLARWAPVPCTVSLCTLSERGAIKLTVEYPWDLLLMEDRFASDPPADVTTEWVLITSRPGDYRGLALGNRWNTQREYTREANYGQYDGCPKTADLRVPAPENTQWTTLQGLRKMVSKKDITGYPTSIQ